MNLKQALNNLPETDYNVLSVLSGGLDSSVMTTLLVEKYGKDKVSALSYDYGQKQIIELTKASDTAAIFLATIKRTEVKSQKKTLQECSKLVINRSNKNGSGTGLLGDGLTSSDVYGTRVQDKEIGLHFPDIVRV